MTQALKVRESFLLSNTQLNFGNEAFLTAE